MFYNTALWQCLVLLQGITVWMKMFCWEPGLRQFVIPSSYQLRNSARRLDICSDVHVWLITTSHSLRLFRQRGKNGNLNSHALNLTPVLLKIMLSGKNSAIVYSIIQQKGVRQLHSMNNSSPLTREFNRNWTKIIWF